MPFKKETVSTSFCVWLKLPGTALESLGLSESSSEVPASQIGAIPGREELGEDQGGAQPCAARPTAFSKANIFTGKGRFVEMLKGPAGAFWIGLLLSPSSAG